MVEEAADERHPLHSRFEWDDLVAGHAWRLEQARSLIQSVRITYKDASARGGARQVRAFQSIQTPDGRRYETSEDVAADPLLREMALRDMEREWKQLRDRYKHFVEFVEMIQRDLAA